MEGASPLNGSRRSPKLSVMWPSTAQTEGVYENRQLKDGSKPQATAEDGDRGGILLKKGILLDGLIESVFRLTGCPRRRSNRVITEHAVSHGDFSGERLQRIEALVGIVDGCLQWRECCFTVSSSWRIAL